MVAAASRSRRNAEDFSREFGGIATYSDYREMLDRERPAMVSVCAYPRDRVPMVRAAIDAGARILWVEKPFALSLEEADAMLDAADAAGVRVFVDYQRRYGEPFAVAHDVLQAGRIGSLESIDLVQPGRNILDFGPHLMDTAAWFLGDRRPTRAIAAVDLTARDAHHGVRVERALFGAIDFEGGVRLTMSTGEQQPELLATIRANGSEGFIELRAVTGDCSHTLTVCAHDRIGRRHPQLTDTFHVGDHPNAFYDRALADMLRAVDESGSCMLDAVNSLETIELTNALLESARLRAVVELPLAQRGFPLDLDW
jgi:predicted dehydrogenase